MENGNRTREKDMKLVVAKEQNALKHDDIARRNVGLSFRPQQATVARGFLFLARDSLLQIANFQERRIAGPGPRIRDLNYFPTAFSGILEGIARAYNWTTPFLNLRPPLEVQNLQSNAELLQRHP